MLNKFDYQKNTINHFFKLFKNRNCDEKFFYDSTSVKGKRSVFV